MKNNDQKLFPWCHIRHINPVKIHPERITQKRKELVNILIMKELNFLCWKNKLTKLKRKITLRQCFLLGKWINLSNLHFRSKI